MGFLERNQLTDKLRTQWSATAYTLGVKVATGTLPGEASTVPAGKRRPVPYLPTVPGSVFLGKEVGAGEKDSVWWGSSPERNQCVKLHADFSAWRKLLQGVWKSYGLHGPNKGKAARAMSVVLPVVGAIVGAAVSVVATPAAGAAIIAASAAAGAAAAKAAAAAEAERSATYGLSGPSGAAAAAAQGLSSVAAAQVAAGSEAAARAAAVTSAASGVVFGAGQPGTVGGESVHQRFVSWWQSVTVEERKAFIAQAVPRLLAKGYSTADAKAVCAALVRLGNGA